MKEEPVYIDSPILGRTKLPNKEEREEIKKMVEKMPLGVFQELNKYLNGMNKMLNIVFME